MGYCAAPVDRFLTKCRDNVGPIHNERNKTLQCTTVKVWHPRFACRILQPRMYATSTAGVAHPIIDPVVNVQAVIYSWTDWPLNMGPIGCPETSVTIYLATPHKSHKSENVENSAVEDGNLAEFSCINHRFRSNGELADGSSFALPRTASERAI